MGMIFDIKRYAIHDGPGIRVTVFVKGCPLSCAWCHNPESISGRPEMMFTAAKCIACGECARVCPVAACRLGPQGPSIDAEACTLCGTCAEACPTGALERVGEELSLADILAIIEKQRPIMDESGGGVTISGGEPLMQAQFVWQLLEACGRREIHRVVDTCGFAPRETLLEIARATDLFLFDLKMMDSAQHRRWTGVDNAGILGNLSALAESGADIEIRMPLIAGVNCAAASVEAAAAFVANLAGAPKLVTLLPFHDLATAKRAKLGRPGESQDMGEPDAADVQRILEQFAAHGVAARSGG